MKNSEKNIARAAAVISGAYVAWMLSSGSLEWTIIGGVVVGVMLFIANRFDK